jgi:predicted dehydrogenase
VVATDRIRVALVGAGSHARRNILPTLSYLPVDLIAVCDTAPDRAKEAADQYGARPYTSTAEMYEKEDLDAVFMVVSPRLHPDLAIEAFGAGLHVWTEKPVAVSTARIDEMIAARGDRICIVGYKKAFMPAVVKTRELLSLDEVGPLVSVLGVYPVGIPDAEPDDTGAFPVSNWLTSGCHALSVLRVVGGPVESVVVHRGPQGGGACVLRHASGMVSNLHLAVGASKFQPCERYLFVTSNASIQIENSRKVTYQRGLRVAYAEDFTFAPPGLDFGAIVWEAQDTMATMQGKNVVTQGIYGGLSAFCHAILDKSVPDAGTLEFARDVTAVYEAALRSHGEPIKVGDI